VTRSPGDGREGGEVSRQETKQETGSWIHLERHRRVVEVINKDLSVRGARNKDGEACVHRVDTLREIDTQHGLALASVPILRRRRRDLSSTQSIERKRRRRRRRRTKGDLYLDGFVPAASDKKLCLWRGDESHS